MNCERCKAPVSYQAAEITPRNQEPGVKIFYCSECDHYTWIERASPASGLPVVSAA